MRKFLWRWRRNRIFRLVDHWIVRILDSLSAINYLRSFMRRNIVESKYKRNPLENLIQRDFIFLLHPHQLLRLQNLLVR